MGQQVKDFQNVQQNIDRANRQLLIPEDSLLLKQNVHQELEEEADQGIGLGLNE